MASVATARMTDIGSMSSPKKHHIKHEDIKPPLPSIIHPEDSKVEEKKDSAGPTNAPLAPPPRPSEANNNQDQYGQRSEGNYFSKEPNPFENAFGSSDTPGKPQLPGVTSLTSPAPLLGGTTPGWPSSLRSGPLSPAMLSGPTNNDYFTSDHHFAGSFPTPNESSLRTGLTPGGGGSMFPQPSPNSQAMFNAIQSGGATPGTLDFHRTAMHARAASHSQAAPTNFNNNNAGVTSAPSDSNIQPGLDGKGFTPANGHQNREQFEQHDAADAANGLYMLANARNGNSNQKQSYPPPPAAGQAGYSQQVHSQDVSPTQAKRPSKNSIGSNQSMSSHGGEEQYSEHSDTKPSTRKNSKKALPKINNSRRKAEDTPSKVPNKRQKANDGLMMPPPDDEDSDEEPIDLEHGPDGKKLTDEEKRKNFLERNRIAALKCRQRKKQWLANLQQKVEIYSTENDALAATVTQLREEIVGIKTLLLAHKDCPVSQAQGISGMAMQSLAGDTQGYGNPYGMGMGGAMQQHQMQQGQMQRR